MTSYNPRVIVREPFAQLEEMVAELGADVVLSLANTQLNNLAYRYSYNKRKGAEKKAELREYNQLRQAADELGLSVAELLKMAAGK